MHLSIFTGHASNYTLYRSNNSIKAMHLTRLLRPNNYHLVVQIIDKKHFDVIKMHGAVADLGI